jgi:hypothetical protein
LNIRYGTCGRHRDVGIVHILKIGADGQQHCRRCHATVEARLDDSARAQNSNASYKSRGNGSADRLDHVYYW